MNDTWRWVVGVAVAVLIVSLIVWGRGAAHHRGTDVGVHTSGTHAPVG
jgi:hypothetical protein